MDDHKINIEAPDEALPARDLSPLAHDATPQESAEARQWLAIERAIGDLRRGAVVGLDSEQGYACLLVAAETLGAVDLQRLRNLGPARLILSAQRASVLHLANVTGQACALVPATAWSAAFISALADPLQDLARPLRGPFQLDDSFDPALADGAVRLNKLARLLPAAVAVALPTEQARAWLAARDLLLVPTAALARFESDNAERLSILVDAPVPLDGAEECRLIAFRPSDGGLEHLAIVIGALDRTRPVLIRLHSACLTGDVLGSLRCDCGPQLRGAIAAIREAGGGVLLYLAQEGRGIGLINKLRAYRLQDQGFDTVDANIRLGFESDERLFLPAARILRQLNIDAVRLLTNNPDKVEQLRRHGINVVERVAHKFPANPHNSHYLDTKARRSGHYL